MIAVFGALLPIFLLIMLGWGLRARRTLTDAFWLGAERLTYYLLFPALLVSTLAEARLDGMPVGGVVGTQAIATLSAALLAAGLARVAHRPPLVLDGPGFTSVFQGVIRPNTYVGLAAAGGLFGAAGLTLTALCVALTIPLVNLLAVLAMVRWAAPGEGGTPGWRRVMLPIAANPLIGACLAGILLNVSGIGLPLVGPVFKILGQASLALGLLSVGAGLDVRGWREMMPALVLASVGKLVVLPLLTGLTAMRLGLHGLPLVICVTYSGLPASPSAFVLARLMGGDARLMSAAITATTVLAAVTLPIAIALAGGVP
jgi:predicted permease